MLPLPTSAELLGLLSGWLLAAFGWIKWLHELREKRRERAAKEKAETALLEIRRRATDSSPLFLLSSERFNGVTIPGSKPTEHFVFLAGHACLLCYMRDEVDRKVPLGEFIYLLVEHRGSDAYEISIQLDEEEAGFIQAEADGHYPIYAIRYAYRPEYHGREQTIKVRFLAANGVRDTHRYATSHGIRAIKRIDPA